MGSPRLRVEWADDGRSARLCVGRRVVGYLVRTRWAWSDYWSHTLRADGHAFGRARDALADAAGWLESKGGS